MLCALNDPRSLTPDSGLGSLWFTSRANVVETRDMSEELPHELLLSIGRILDIKESPETDPLDTIGGQFNVVDIINDYFPDGAYVFEEMRAKSPMPPCYFLRGITWATGCGSSAAISRRTGSA